MVSRVSRLRTRARGSPRMGEVLPRSGRARKRHRSEYRQVGEDIEFLIDCKRSKLGSDGEESNDGSSEDRSSPEPLAQLGISDRRKPLEKTVKPVEVKLTKPVVGTKPKLTAEVKLKPNEIVKQVAETKADGEVKVTEDNRDCNRRSPNGFLLPDPLPRGEILCDTIKQNWVLGKAIGVGGFGELYLAAFRSPDGATSPEKFVVKVEPHSNGPLFVEVHFYLRATKQEELEKFKAEHGLQHLGVPKLVANGSHVKKGQNYRFLVMERFGSDLQRILDNSEGNKFTVKTACSVTLQVLDSLQYIHSQGYVHKDVKGSNLLVGLGLDGQHLVHLVDYGLCSKYKIGDFHKQYRHDMRWAHEGTMEYTSRDAHIGCASRRGDLEVLFYNLIEWFGGSLPWDRECASPQVTKTAKFLAFRQMNKFLKICFRGEKFPVFLPKFMKYVSGLMFEEEPDYQYLKEIVQQEMVRAGCVLDHKLEFKLAKLSDSPTAQDNLQPELLFGPSKKPPTERVSAVFDTTCISEKSYEQHRDDIWAARSQQSLDNPTQAMLDIIEKMERPPESVAKGRKRTKSFCFEEATTDTPAMKEVLKLRKLKSLEENTVPDPESARIIPSPLIRFPGLIPAAVVMPPRKKAKKLVERSNSTVVETNSELRRLATYLDDPPQRRRTRSDATGNAREIRGNLRSALSFGLGVIRSVSQSLQTKFLNYEIK